MASTGGRCWRERECLYNYVEQKFVVVCTVHKKMIFKVSAHLETTFGVMSYKTHTPRIPVFLTPPRSTVNSTTKNFQFDQVENSFEGSLLRFTDWEKRGFNPKQAFQYFFPQRDKNTNETNGEMYSSIYCYTYTPRTPLNIVNIKLFTSKFSIDSLPPVVHQYFTHNENKEVVRSKPSDEHDVDNAFYEFIFKQVNAHILGVDGVYMPANGAAHEEIVLQRFALDKLDTESQNLRNTVHEQRRTKKRRVTFSKRLDKRLDFGTRN